MIEEIDKDFWSGLLERFFLWCDEKQFFSAQLRIINSSASHDTLILNSLFTMIGSAGELEYTENKIFYLKYNFWSILALSSKWSTSREGELNNDMKIYWTFLLIRVIETHNGHSLVCWRTQSLKDLMSILLQALGGIGQWQIRSESRYGVFYEDTTDYRLETGDNVMS